MANLEELHAAVLCAPEEDAPRLAYADAVEASDPDRAALIRMQFAICESLRAGTGSSERALLYSRVRTLIEKNGARWTKDVAQVPGVAHPILGRRFVEWITLSARTFLDHGAELYQRAPILHVDLEDVRPHARELFESPLLDRIHSLGLRAQQLGDPEAKLLASSAHLGNLRFLELSANKIGPEGIEALAASGTLRALRFVDFKDNPAPDPTPQTTEGDSWGTAYRLETPEAGRVLIKKYGERAWLSADALSRNYPPARGDL